MTIKGLLHLEQERGAFALGGSPEVLAGLAPHLGSLEKDDVQKWQVGFTDQAVPGMPSTPATATQALELLAKVRACVMRAH